MTHSSRIVKDHLVQALLSVWNMRQHLAHLRSLALSLWSHVGPPSGILIDRCHQANTDNSSRNIHMLLSFCHTCAHIPTDPHTYTYVYCTYTEAPHIHMVTYTLTTPLHMQTFTHWNTCLLCSPPLQVFRCLPCLHPSVVPSLPCFKSLIKTLTVCGSEV